MERWEGVKSSGPMALLCEKGRERIAEHKGRYVAMRGNHATHRHGCFNRRGPPRPRGRIYFPQKKRWWVRLHEKNGNLN